MGEKKENSQKWCWSVVLIDSLVSGNQTAADLRALPNSTRCCDKALYSFPVRVMENEAPNSAIVIISYYWTNKLKFSTLFKATESMLSMKQSAAVPLHTTHSPS